MALLLSASACAAVPDAIGAAQLAAPNDKPSAALRQAADIPGPACVAEHRAVIEEALVVARQRMAVAIEVARTQPDHPNLTRWFGNAPRQEIAARLQQTALWLDQPENLKLLCNDPSGCGTWRMAYTAPSRRIVGLCPAFFRARMTGFDTRWGVLIHEASHLGAGTQDHAYGPEAALILAKADPRRAAMNADNFEYFVETLGQQQPSMGV
jgi:peptidyl-Lys metalloendopeptidase